MFLFFPVCGNEWYNELVSGSEELNRKVWIIRNVGMSCNLQLRPSCRVFLGSTGRCSAGQGISCSYRSRRFVTMFTKVYR
jgi:hypothetical protein